MFNSKIFLPVIILLFAFVSISLGQDGVVPVDVEQSEDLGSVLLNYFTTTTALAGFVVILFQFINDKIIKYAMNATWTQVVTWVLAGIVSFLGWKLNLGIFMDAGMLEFVYSGIVVGLMANGMYQFEWVQWLLGVFKLLTNKPTNELTN